MGARRRGRCDGRDRPLLALTDFGRRLSPPLRRGMAPSGLAGRGFAPCACRDWRAGPRLPWPAARPARPPPPGHGEAVRGLSRRAGLMAAWASGNPLAAAPSIAPPRRPAATTEKPGIRKDPRLFIAAFSRSPGTPGRRAFRGSGGEDDQAVLVNLSAASVTRASSGAVACSASLKEASVKRPASATVFSKLVRARLD